ncbi:hypothetical protein KI387_001079, partial [Taxus chinensis]
TLLGALYLFILYVGSRTLVVELQFFFLVSIEALLHVSVWILYLQYWRPSNVGNTEKRLHYYDVSSCYYSVLDCIFLLHT